MTRPIIQAFTEEGLLYHWNQLSPQHQQNLINHWNNDIARAQAYRAIAEGVLGGACK